jgi:rhodanese-related sulfurtransferase
LKLISRDELKEKLDREDNFKLVMVLREYAFKAKRIPGSLHIFNLKEVKEVLNPKDEIVVYCSGPGCHASADAFYILGEMGYKNVRRYAGGIEDWEEAGYPLEGEMVE